jgi:hypothetical protein
MALRKAAKSQAVAACFDSEAEYRRWHELILLQRAGKIERLERQTPIPIVVNGVTCFTIEPDFSFFENGKRVYDDTKGRSKGFEWRQFRDRWTVANAVFPNAVWRVNGEPWQEFERKTKRTKGK